MSGIEIDPAPIFESITTNLVWILAVFALPIGIKVAMGIAGWFGDALSSAFKRGK